MRIGLIGRATRQGIAYQSENFYRGYKPDKVLMVRTYGHHWKELPSWAPGAEEVRHLGLHDGFEDQEPVMRFLDDVDVVFSVETLYDWGLARYAQSKGVKTVVQGNPEFFRHEGLLTGAPHPTRWTWPTEWLTDSLPRGPVIPVPTTGLCTARAADPYSTPFTIAHVAGHRAAGDRNGTEIFLDGIRYMKGRTHVRLYGLDGAFPAMPSRLPPHVTVEVVSEGVDDRWSMYDGVHMLVLPRRYGGNCMPATEAMEAGVALMMTDCSPNLNTWPIFPMQGAVGKSQHTPFGILRTYLVRSRAMAYEIDRVNGTREVLAEKMAAAREWAKAHSWDQLRPRYQELFESL